MNALIPPDHPQITLRSPEEIQRAHDTLIALLYGEVPSPWAEDFQRLTIAAIDALCWVLQHDHNQNFEKNLQLIEEVLADHGIAIVDTGRLQKRGD